MILSLFMNHDTSDEIRRGVTRKYCVNPVVLRFAARTILIPDVFVVSKCLLVSAPFLIRQFHAVYTNTSPVTRSQTGSLERVTQRAQQNCNAMRAFPLFAEK
jgi:hypothetical protein